ncbi:hypothetical protein PROFUN_02715 [Planoprotostelium fungivorum]|uniref:Proteasome subunit beta n=1 Tax=Planoprotostelium fungivorum TaxID=1890364 RepID=A0A2P6NVT2_9EUKA|nr:hypothetical protein PROFUN_02715 [Planoprotostelium fungivorum]
MDSSYGLDLNKPLYDGRYSWFDHSKFGGTVYEPKPNDPSTRTTDPIVTGTSVLAVKYKGGVAIAADTLLSYGSLARFRDIRRIHKLNEHTIIGSSGEYSDFQYITRMLDDVVTDNHIADNNLQPMDPKSIFSYLSRVMYQRRNKQDPLYNNIVVAGYRNGESFLGSVDLLGTHYQDDHIATGFGDHIARPLLRNAYKPDLTKEEAVKLLEKCLTVLFYRDARAYYRVQICTIGEDGVNIAEPQVLQTDWSVGNVTYGYDGRRTALPQA